MDLQQQGDRIFHEGIRLGRKLRIAVSSGSSQTLPENDYKRAMLFFFSKAFKTYEAMCLLWKAKYVEDGTVLGRSLFELNMQAEWMSRDPSIRARQFLEQFPVRAYDLHCRMKLYAERIRDNKTTAVIDILSQEAGFDALRSGHDINRHKFTKRRGKKEMVWENWWAGTIFQLAQWLDAEIRARGERGDDFEWEYNFIYFQECELAHTGTTSIVQNSKSSPDLSQQPTLRTSSAPLFLPYSATVRFFRTADILRLAYNINLLDDFYRARSKIMRLSGF